MEKLRCREKLFFYVESLVGTIMSVCVKFQRKKNDHIPVFWRLKVDIFRPTGIVVGNFLGIPIGDGYLS